MLKATYYKYGNKYIFFYLTFFYLVKYAMSDYSKTITDSVVINNFV